MAIPRFDEDLAIISKLGDNPGSDNNLTTDAFRAKFDEGPQKIQQYLNDVLIPAAEQSSSPQEGLNMEGSINMNGQPLTGIAAPVADTDAVNLKALNDVTEPLKRLQFTNVSVAVSKFKEDTTHEDYPMRANVTLSGVKSTMVPEVIFSLADAVSGNFAPVAQSYNGGVYIYAAEAPEEAMAIPTIICWKGDT
jgi:hypothetical protein